MKTKKYAILVAGFLVNIFLFNLTSFASNQGVKETKHLNPEFVKTRILETDWNIKLKERALDKAYDNVKLARAGMQKAIDNFQPSTPDSVKEATYYSVDNKINLAEIGVSKARNDYELSKTKAQLSAEQKYYDLIKKQKQYYIDMEKVKVAEESYRIAQTRYKVGQISRKEVIDADVQLSGAKLAAEVSKNQYEIQAFSFKKFLGYDKNTSIVLDEPMTYSPYKQINIVLELDDLVEESNDMKMAKEALDAYKENVDLGKERGLQGTDAYDEAVSALADAELNYDMGKGNMEVAVYGAYITLQTSAEQIKILDKKLQSAQESLRVEKLRYKNGLSTNLQVAQTTTQYIEVLNQRLEAIYTFNINKAKFENNLFSDMVGGM